MTTIAVDAMGGDHAPAVVVEGTVEALRERKEGLSVILVGDRERIAPELAAQKADGLPLTVHHAAETVEMADSPSKVFKAKPNSSMNVCLKLQAEGKANASLSAGNTGALLVAATLILGRLPNVQRPAIAITIPGMKSPCILIDGGANADCKPTHLVQFAMMGSAFAELVHDMASPKVALLSVGTESTKGNELTLQTYPLLEKSPVNFVGNLEGNVFLTGDAQVAVCDGFVGNIVLKLVESISTLLKSSGSGESDRFEYSRYGGAPFLGVNGVCIKAHGGSSARAIKNAIFAAEKAVRLNLNSKISAYLEETI